VRISLESLPDRTLRYGLLAAPAYSGRVLSEVEGMLPPERLRILNEYITAGRYPGDLAIEDVGPDQAQEALDAAHEIRDAVVARIPTSQ
jgi:hypothetical protein